MTQVVEIYIILTSILGMSESQSLINSQPFIKVTAVAVYSKSFRWPDLLNQRIEQWGIYSLACQCTQPNWYDLRRKSGIWATYIGLVHRRHGTNQLDFTAIHVLVAALSISSSNMLKIVNIRVIINTKINNNIRVNIEDKYVCII